jgi:hypothetical protein
LTHWLGWLVGCRTDAIRWSIEWLFSGFDGKYKHFDARVPEDAPLSQSLQTHLDDIVSRQLDAKRRLETRTERGILEQSEHATTASTDVTGFDQQLQAFIDLGAAELCYFLPKAFNSVCRPTDCIEPYAATLMTVVVTGEPHQVLHAQRLCKCVGQSTRQVDHRVSNDPCGSSIDEQQLSTCWNWRFRR